MTRKAARAYRELATSDKAVWSYEQKLGFGRILVTLLGSLIKQLPDKVRYACVGGLITSVLILVVNLFLAGNQTSLQNAPLSPARPARHISREAAEQFQDVIAPYGSIQNAAQRGSAILDRCQTLEAADLLRDIYDPFYNVHWNVHEVTGEAARFYRDGTVYVQGTFPDDVDKGLKALFRDSGIKAHVRQLGVSAKSQVPELGIDVECNE